MAIPSNRNLWIDALRAFLAIGVIHSHIVARCSQGAWEAHNMAVDFMKIFRVPTFFFISGYIIYFQIIKRLSSGEINFKSLVSKKFRQLIVPSVIFTLIPSVIIGFEILSHLNTAHYFLPSLFFITASFCGIYACINRLSKPKQCVILLCYGLLTTVIMSLTTHLPVQGYLHWRQTLHGNIFFILGIVTGAYSRQLLPLLKKPVTVVTLGAVYTLSYLILTSYLYDSSIGTALHRVVCPIIGIYFVFSLFCAISGVFKPDNFIGKLSFFIGQRTLPLYLVHDLTFTTVLFFLDINTFDSPQIMVFVVLLLSVLLILLFHEIICKFGLVNRYVFGRKARLAGFSQTFTA